MSVAVSRVLDCLRVVAEAHGGMTATEVAHRLSISRPAATRLLESLRKYDVVRKDEFARRYRLGVGLYWLGSGALATATPILIARNELIRLVADLRRPVQFVVLAGSEIAVLERTDWVDGTIVCTPLQGRSSWHLTAVGRVLVAFAPETIAGHAWRALLPEIRDQLRASGLMGELETIRRQRYAEARETLRPGAFAVAVPILDQRGHAAAALGMATTEEELAPDSVQEVVAPLQVCAERVSYQLGYRQMDLSILT